ncbi:MAG TPA: nucleotidyltransferase domain-containing protein [Myxococcota bacterium]|nr:nucleotidyltransferase domain-containing protein [Myxococcota bacterium]
MTRDELARAVPALGAERTAVVCAMAERIAALPGVAAVVLGGSFARGRATGSSDVDLGVFYREAAPFPQAELRALAREWHDAPAPVVTEPWVWGPWVNGGAWLTAKGQRVDWLWRSAEHVARVIDDAEHGRFELHYGQQPPFGFFGPTYLGEVAICVPLADPDGVVAALKRRVERYPEALRSAVVQSQVWGAQFNLESFAPKFAARGDSWATGACLARAAHQLVLALFALHRRWLLSDKTALAELADFAPAPRDFGARVERTLARVGASPAELARSVAALAALVEETIAASGALYRRPFPRL